jgi:hypothetical protein
MPKGGAGSRISTIPPHQIEGSKSMSAARSELASFGKLEGLLSAQGVVEFIKIVDGIFETEVSDETERTTT